METLGAKAPAQEDDPTSGVAPLRAASCLLAEDRTMTDLLERIGDALRLGRMGRLAAALAALRDRVVEEAAAPEPALGAPAQGGPRPAAVLLHPAGPRPRRRASLGEAVRALAESRRQALALEETVEAPEAPEAPESPEALETPLGARFEARRFEGVQGGRDYKLFVPPPKDAAERQPLVVMLHGCTQTPDDFALGTGMNAAAAEAGAIVLYPAQAASANPKRCWNWFRPEDAAEGPGEAALLADLTRLVLATENVDPDRIYVAGLSAGGAQAMNLAARFPELFAAAGVHSGLAAGAAQDVMSAFSAMRGGAPGAPTARPVRTIVFHGDADRTVHPANAEAVAAQAVAAAGALQLQVEEGEAGGRNYSRALRRNRRGEVLCETWTIHGAGHVWSGGDPAGSYAEAEGPNATREMLRFFLDG